MITQKVAQYIRQHHLFDPTDKLLVALSGGADSVALLRILLALGYQCEAAHCNFHLRGEESNRDEAFVTDLCRQLNIKLHVTHFDTQTEAETKHISIEMAARELRYQWFETIRQNSQAKFIVVAHHADDSIETFLINLLRGSGINGLQGIRALNGQIVRPLLCLRREEIIDYLGTLGQTFVTDSTNLQDNYLRNKIRLNLLPLMHSINPAAEDNILKTTLHLEEAALIYHNGIEEARKRIQTAKGIRIEALLRETAPATLLFEILHPLGFNESQINDIFHSLKGQAGKVFETPQWKVVKDREFLLIGAQQVITPPTLHKQEVEYHPDFIIPRDKHIACFDADQLTHPLTVRRWKAGDSFVPFGMKGRKLVSDYLTDRKFSLLQKEQQWVVCCGNDIIWLIGERSDNRYRITSHTQHVLILSV